MEDEWIVEALWCCAGIRVRGSTVEPVGGGSINRALKVSGERGPIFVKVNEPTTLDMFEAEARGLEALRTAGGVRVPGTVAVGRSSTAAFIALEWIDFGPKTDVAERRLGAGLARQHRSTSTTFGWGRDNTIGSTPQVNRPSDDWAEFFATRRLRYQLDLAQRNGLPAETLAAGIALLDVLDEVLGGHRPAPSLLHGDLWGGNWGTTTGDEPLIFDPAIYYGDREADVAMTRLFGGFGPEFYVAYEAEWPLPVGWQRRAELYNLYHLLNHFNLFGASYAPAVGGAIERCARSR